MKAAVVSIGDEFTLGERVDTNSAWLSSQLAQQCVNVVLHHSLPDDRQAIAAALAGMAPSVDLLLVTGGLGPTKDDLTRFALADVLGEKLITDVRALEELKRRYNARGGAFVEANLVQVRRPPSTQFIPNSIGTAPGISARIGKTQAFFLPGVPAEMRAMWSNHVRSAALPTGADKAAQSVRTAVVQCVALAESRVGTLLADLMTRENNPQVGTMVADGITCCRIRGVGEPGRIERRVDSVTREIERRLHPYVFASDNRSLPQSINIRLVRMRKTLVTAESCTAGLVGAMITEPPGSSVTYRGGWQTYSNEMKIDCLGVDAATIQDHGAVSGLVADQMAVGALDRSGADYAIGLTGIAGPGGGTQAKPVGTAYIALAEIDTDGRPTALVKRFLFPGKRDAIRQRAALAALAMLHLFLANEGLIPDMLWEYQPDLAPPDSPTDDDDQESSGGNIEPIREAPDTPDPTVPAPPSPTTCINDERQESTT